MKKVRFNDDLDIHYVEKITIPSNSELSDLESRDSEKKNRFNIFFYSSIIIFAIFVICTILL